MTKRLIMLCLCCFIIQVTKAQGKELLSLSVKNEPLKEILKKIESQCEYRFVYNETIDLSVVKTVSFKDKNLGAALQLVFNNSGIEWKISGKHILLKKTAKKVTISGFVSDLKNKETLIGASVSDKNSQSATMTNDYGYFTFTVPAGTQNLHISYVGYTPVDLPLSLNKDSILKLELEQQNWLKEIVVTPKKVFSPSSGSIEFSMEDIKNTPVPFGETDIIKTLQLLPGVQAGIEGSSGLYVRGGGPDQNLTLLDGVNVYNTSHFYGLFSIFNGDAVKKVTLYKGSFPARFGGRLSSVIDTRMKDGDMRNYHGGFSIGLLSSRFNLEGPILKDKTSFSFSARRSYIDGFLRIADVFTDETVPIIYFYDVNAKLNHKFSDKSRLYFSFYQGKDKMGFNTEDDGGSKTNFEDVDYHWGNTIGSLRWNYVFNNKLFVNTTVAYNNYNLDFKNKVGYKSVNKYQPDQKDYNYEYTTYQYSGIEDWSGNVDFEYLPNNRHHIRFGGGYIYHTFKPEVHGTKQYEQKEGTIIKDVNHSFLSENIKANEASLYIEDEIAITDQWKTNVGIHSSMFEVGGKSYWSVQPRLSLGYEMNDNLSFKTSYTEMNQYIHLLTSSALSQPTDLWVPVTPNLSPLSSRQVTLGAFYDTRKGYNFSIEGFYKTMKNLLEYKDGSSWASPSTTWDRQVESGDGRTYGVELFAQKTTGKLTGWIGYTLAWNDRKFPTINGGKRFPAKYDRRHDVKLNLVYKMNEKFDFSAAWTFASGNNVTLALEEYPTLPGNELEDSRMTNVNYYNGGGYNYTYIPTSKWIEKYGDRNNYRIDPTHHLDLSINYYRKKSPKGRQASWNLTIYNVYNQACPFLVYPGFSDNKGKFVLKRISLLPILPSLTYTYKF